MSFQNIESLNSDGINFALFHLLWNKQKSHQKEQQQQDQLGEGENSDSDTDNGGGVRIPDSVIFQFGQPLFWYFTSHSNNNGNPCQKGQQKKRRGRKSARKCTILRKRKPNLTIDKIEDVFLDKARRDGFITNNERPKQQSSDVVAYFISFDHRHSTKEKINNSLSDYYQDDGNQNDNQHYQDIEYFNSEKLHEFLIYGRKDRTGLLQRFIPPLGSQNSQIQSIYTPKLLLLERRTNKHQIHDSRFGLYERTITFDGPHVHSTPCPIFGTVLQSKLKVLNDQIVNHVYNVSFGAAKIIRMVAHWKIDSKERIWLLYTSCLRCDQDSSSRKTQSILNIDSTMISIPKSVHLEQNPNHDSDIVYVENYVNTKKCASCFLYEKENKFHPIAYKTIIAHFDKVIQLLSVQNVPTGGNHDESFVKRDQSTYELVHWPPDLNTIKAVGNIGFGYITKDENYSNLVNKKIMHNSFIQDDIDTEQEEEMERKLQDIRIPPMIRFLHPRLKTNGFAKYRQDPLFLHKQCFVCETCFLAFAKLSSSNFSQIACTASKSSTNTKNFSRRMFEYGLHKNTSSITTKSFQDAHTIDNKWLPLPNRDKDHNCNSMKKANTLSNKNIEKTPTFFKESVSPQLPDAILNIKDETSTSIQDFEDVIKQRERIFFKEMALEGKHSLKGHPLSHMVDTEKVLKQISEQADEANSKEKLRKKGRNPYEEDLVSIHGTFSSQSKKHEKKANHPQFKGKTKLPYPPKIQNDIFKLHD